jgi:hypothetical protein
VRAADGRTLGVVEGSFDVRRLGRFGHTFADGGGHDLPRARPGRGA